MKKRWQKLAVWLGVMVLLFSLVGCGSKDMAMDMESSNGGYREDFSPGAEAPMEDSLENSFDGAGELSDVRADRKIIENMDLSVQTKEFDVLLEKIEQQVYELKGYIESSSISGQRMDSNNKRFAEMKLRIPSEHSNTFSNYISENSVVVHRYVYTDDVTLAYVDMESRVKAKTLE